MSFKKHAGSSLSGFCAGAVNGLFGAGGGMLLVPMLSIFTDLDEGQIFPASVCIILPICMISLLFTFDVSMIPWHQTILYMLGSLIGGILSGFFGKKIPTLWLHRVLGILVLWGGIRYLC